MVGAVCCSDCCDGVGEVSSLLQLAERCEQATAPDRELDAEICCVGPLTDADWVTGASASLNRPGMVTRYFDGGGHGTLVAPSYTSSLDAAMRLVPKGMILRRYMATRYVPHGCEVAVDWAHGGWDGHSDHSFALALCAAALRARAASADTHPKDGDVKQAPLVSGAVAKPDAPETSQ